MGAGGIETTWSHDWPFAAWFSLLLIVGLLGWTMFAYRRDRARLSRKQGNLLLLVRMMTLAGILAAAWGWQEIRYETDLPDLIILADVSQSMNEADGLSGSRRIESWKRGFKKKGIENPTRLDITKSLLGERSHWLAQIKRRYQLRYFGTGEMLSRHRVSLKQSDSEIANLQATANASRLGQGIKDAVHAARGVPTVGIVLFTDGAVTSGPSLMEAAEYARQNNLPLYLVGLGSREVGRDIAVETVLVDDPVFLGDRIGIDVSLATKGLAGETITIELKDAAGSSLSLEQLEVQADQPIHSVRFWTEAKTTGIQQFLIQAAPVLGERDTENNHSTFSVDVRDTAIKVLLVSAQPSWEFRYLKQLLDRTVSDETRRTSIELTTILQDSDLEHAAQDHSFDVVVPIRREQLFEYDVVILLDADLGRLGRSVLEHLREFVEQRGGGLIIGAGPRHFPQTYRATPLQMLLPAEINSMQKPHDDELLTESFRVEPTRLGLEHPVLRLETASPKPVGVWPELPPLRWFVAANRLVPGTQALLQTDPNKADIHPIPILMWRFFGTGQVVMHTTDETYRWARFRESSRQYSRYWMQLLRELGRGRLKGEDQGVELTTNRKVYQLGESVVVRARFLHPLRLPIDRSRVSIRWSAPSGTSGTIELIRLPSHPDWFEAGFEPPYPGPYRISLSHPNFGKNAPAISIQINSGIGESAHHQRDQQALLSAARVSTGKLYEIDDVTQLVRDLPSAQPTRVESLPPQPLWNRPLWLLLLACGLFSEWFFRKKWYLG